MGIELVKLVSLHGASLSGNAFKVLNRMAMTALDSPKDGRPDRLYFNGWEPLAMALGYADGDVSHGSPGFQGVKRALATLRKEGFVEPLGEARAGTRQTYRVCVGLASGGQKVIPSGGRKVTPKWGSESDPSGGQKVTPLGHIQDTGQDLTQDRHDDSQPSPTSAREGSQPDDSQRVVGGHRFVGLPGEDCLECEGAYQNRKLHPLHLLDFTA